MTIELTTQHAEPGTSVSDVVARANLAAGSEAARVWRRFGPLLETTDARSLPVLANTVALMTLQDSIDLGEYARLVRELGHESLARIQIQCLRRLGDGPDRVLATILHQRLEAADGICRRGAHHLLVQDVELDGPAQSRWVRSVAQLRQLLTEGTVAERRPFVASVLAVPWGPYAAGIRELAEAGGPDLVEGVEGLIAVAREVVERRERRQVAEQVRRLIQRTGLAQREFAARVGTSPSRLSTYVSGKVTPSAAMLVRITRTARSLEAVAETRYPV